MSKNIGADKEAKLVVFFRDDLNFLRQNFAAQMEVSRIIRSLTREYVRFCRKHKAAKMTPEQIAVLFHRTLAQKLQVEDKAEALDNVLKAARRVGRTGVNYGA